MSGTAVTTRDLDALDREIIEQLQEDGRRSNVAIARALGVTETTIRHRIDRLISNGFIRIAAVIDPRKTPYLIDAMIWIRLERGRAREAGRRIAALPNVVYVAYTAGRYDMLVEALFESDEELLEFMTSKLSKTVGVLQSETYHVLQTVKINYDWKLPLDEGASARTGRVNGASRVRWGRLGAVRRSFRARAEGGSADGPSAREPGARGVARREGGDSGRSR